MVLEQPFEANSVGSQTPIQDDFPEIATAVTAQMTAQMTAQKIDQKTLQKTPEVEGFEIGHSEEKNEENATATQPRFSARKVESHGLKVLEAVGGWPIRAALVFLAAGALISVLMRRRTTTEPRLVRLN